MKQVIQARMIGYAPDLRHPLAPREVVYQCDEPRRRRVPLRIYLLTLTGFGLCAYAVIRTAVFLATGVNITG